MSRAAGLHEAGALIQSDRGGQVGCGLELDAIVVAMARLGDEVGEEPTSKSLPSDRRAEIHLAQLDCLSLGGEEARAADDSTVFIFDDAKDSTARLVAAGNVAEVSVDAARLD